MILTPQLRWAVILNLADACGDLDTRTVVMAVMLLAAVASLLLVASYAEVRHEAHTGHHNLA